MIKGQILEESSFGKKISEVIKEYKPSNIVEIGTWKGLGSTKCIIDAIIYNNLNCNFISLESNLQFHTEAKYNLNEYLTYVKLIYGRIIEKKDILEYIDKKQISYKKSWLMSDLSDINNNTNVVDMLPDYIEFCLFDGGEYSTYPEWTLLKDRIYIVALDDTKTDKCQLIREEILYNTNDYNILIDSDDRNGFIIAENKNYEHK